MTASAGLAFLASGSTPTRGPYAARVQQAGDFLLGHAQPSGVITVLHEESTPTYGHGFAALFLAQVLGMAGDQARQERVRRVVAVQGVVVFAGERAAVPRPDPFRLAAGRWSVEPRCTPGRGIPRKCSLEGGHPAEMFAGGGASRGNVRQGNFNRG